MQHRQSWRQEFLTRCRTASVIRNYSSQLTRNGFFDSLPAGTATFLKEAQFVTHSAVCILVWETEGTVSAESLPSWQSTAFTGADPSGTTLPEKVVPTEGNLPHKPVGVVAGTSSPTCLGRTVCGKSKEQKVFLHHLLINGSCAQTLDTSSGHPWWDHLSDTVETACWGWFNQLPVKE